MNGNRAPPVGPFSHKRFTSGREDERGAAHSSSVDAPTRRLHSAADCFRGIGYSITPMPVRKNATEAMSCFRADHAGDALAVCEMIRDERGSVWPDVSAWYWSAMFGASVGPWWSFVVAERL